MAANLVDFADDDLPHQFGVLLVNLFLFNVTNALLERLPGRQHRTTPEVANIKLTGDVISHFEVFVDLLRVPFLNLRHRIDQVVILHDFLDVENLDVSLIGVENDLEGFIGPVPLVDHRANDVLDNDLERFAVNVLRTGDLPERGNEVFTSHDGRRRFGCQWVVPSAGSLPYDDPRMDLKTGFSVHVGSN